MKKTASEIEVRELTFCNVLNFLRGNFLFYCFINNFVLNGTYLLEKNKVWRVLFVYPQSRLFGNSKFPFLSNHGGQYICFYKRLKDWFSTESFLNCLGLSTESFLKVSCF